jgi:GNAT superfamily N-acetyltransferase
VELDLRPATLEDAGRVADLDTARIPDDPRSAAMVAYWWTHDPGSAAAQRLIGENVYFSARHAAWESGKRRFGTVHVSIHPDVWTPDLFLVGITTGERWLRSEEAEVSVLRIRADFDRDLRVALNHGYRKLREERFWELDLVRHRDRLLAGAEKSRAEMGRQGIELITLDRADDPETLRKVYELDMAATRDIPTTVPHHEPQLDEWARMYFDNPGIRRDRFWIARLGDEVAGMSLIEYPPERGVPATEFTGTSPRFRGRGIARALKYETVAQAIALGATRLRTDNDSENAPILHLNAEMGYEPMTSQNELHREL